MLSLIGSENLADLHISLHWLEEQNVYLMLVVTKN